MKQFFTLIAFVSLYTLSFAQGTPVVLHPAVGDTVFLQSKNDYLLFPEVPNSDFDFGCLAFDGSAYTFTAHLGDQVQAVVVDSNTINTYRNNIEKLFAYYMNQTDPDSLAVGAWGVGDTLNPFPDVKTDYLNQEVREKIGRAARRYQQLYYQAIDKGLQGAERDNYVKTGGYHTIEFKPR